MRSHDMSQLFRSLPMPNSTDILSRTVSELSQRIVQM